MKRLKGTRRRQKTVRGQRGNAGRDLYIMKYDRDVGAYYNACIKIGISGDVQRRACEIASSHPFDMKILHQFEGMGYMERDIHKRLAQYRVQRSNSTEWFKCSVDTALEEYLRLKRERSIPSREEMSTLPEDAERGHIAHSKIQGERRAGTPAGSPAERYTFYFDNEHFQITVSKAGSHGPLIARACYLRFEGGWPKEKVRRWRDLCYSGVKGESHDAIRLPATFEGQNPVPFEACAKNHAG